LNSFGTPVGRIFSSSPKGMAELRKAQIVFSSSPKALELSRTLVAAKGANQVRIFGSSRANTAFHSPEGAMRGTTGREGSEVAGALVPPWVVDYAARCPLLPLDEYERPKLGQRW